MALLAKCSLDRQEDLSANPKAHVKDRTNKKPKIEQSQFSWLWRSRDR